MSLQQQDKKNIWSDDRQPLLVIVGATATGKTALAIELAERFGGEILCADSRTAYRDMDIVTAKPSAAEQAAVKHWGLDLVDPSETFTAADFKAYADRTIADILSRGKLPILVGGSGLYIDAVIYDYHMAPPADPTLRSELNSMSVAQLQQRIIEGELPMPADAQNPRRLMRVIETGGTIGGEADRERGVRADTCIIGIDMELATITQRITDRVDQMIGQGLVEEIARVGTVYGWDAQALQAPGCKAFRGYIAGTQTLDEAKAAFIKNDRALAKRQRTWFRRNKSIQWLATDNKLAMAVDIATTFLSTPFHY